MVKRATRRAAHVEDEAPALEAAQSGQNEEIEQSFNAEAEQPPFDPSEDFRGAVDTFADPVRPRTDHEALLAKTFRVAVEMVMDSLSDISSELMQKHAREAAAEVSLSAIRVRSGISRVAKINETYHAHRNKNAKLVQVHADYTRHGTLLGTELPGSKRAGIDDLESDNIAAHRGRLIDSHVEGFHRLVTGLNGAMDVVAEAIDHLRRVVDARNTARIGNMEDAQQALMDAVLIASKALDFHCAGGIKHVTVVQARASNDNKGIQTGKQPDKNRAPRKKSPVQPVVIAGDPPGCGEIPQAAKTSSRKNYSVL